jgi:hypothetical protein
MTSAGLGALAWSDNKSPSAAWNTARPSACDSILDQLRNVPSPALHAGLPFFCLDLLHHFDFQIAFSDQFLQPTVFIT